MVRIVSYSCLAVLVVAAMVGCGGAIAPGSARGDDAGDGGGDDAFPFDGYDLDVYGFDTSMPSGDDGGLPACNGGVCPSPAPVTGFAPTWIPPAGAHRNVCTTALIDEYYTACLALATSTNCAGFGTDAAHQACQACLVSQYTDSTWGPLVFSQGLVENNASGCIALLDPAALQCAQSVQAADQCEHAACDSVCATGSSAGFDDWVTCAAAANACGCGTWFQASNCVQSLATAQGPAAPCLVGQTFQDLYYSVAAVFCGP